jgi:hypothetical protein
MFKKMAILSLASSALTFSAFAFAESACLTEGSTMIGNKKIEIKECRQNMGEKWLEAVCSETVSPMPGIKNTHVATCPAQPQATCEGAQGEIGKAFGVGKSSAMYYYKSSAGGLELAKRGCEANGGKWTQ